MALAQIVTNILSVLTVAGQAMIALLLLSIVFRNKMPQRFLNLSADNAILFSFIVALVAMMGSLFYSEIAGYEPCKLCWIQRIFMYPQVLILGIALWKKDRSVISYIIPLCILGIMFSSYHYYIQLGGAPLASCDASASCAKRYTFTFGYITIPMMALTAFSMILMFSLATKSRKAV